MDQISLYCLTFQNKKRKEMEKKFENFTCPIHYYSGVSFADHRLKNSPSPRVWSTIFGHLDMISQFYFFSDREYGIFCEDDILIRQDFIQNLDIILQDFQNFNLDLLLLGYLCDNPIDTYSNFIPHPSSTHKTPFQYFSYPDQHTWGTQMYLLSKKQAKTLLDLYGSGEYAQASLKDSNLKPFSADFLLTKNGKRLLIYPLLVIEDGSQDSDIQFGVHQRCHQFTMSVFGHLFNHH